MAIKKTKKNAPVNKVNKTKKQENREGKETKERPSVDVVKKEGVMKRFAYPLAFGAGLLTLGFLGKAAYDNYVLEDKNDNEEVRQETEKPYYHGSIKDRLVTYEQGIDVEVGGNYLTSNVLKAKAGGRSFTFYDYQGRADIDPNAEYKGDRGVERVDIAMENGERYSFSRDMISNSVLGRKAKSMLERASEVYNSVLRSVYGTMKSEEEDSVGPRDDVFRPLMSSTRVASF